ncbi:DUF2946 family protein [Dyella sp. C11]|uniref:DUF2946 family protein n=1 Tax=Dyella sp. C11 TaxID=2126991 RepID=UPI001300BD54|nr:DUF2946 family protein [Dyella sp. C11]
MIRQRASRHLAAWLAVWAMFLLLVAPSVSRVEQAAASAMDAACAMAMHMDGNASDDHASTTADACGYCALMAHGWVSVGSVAFTVPSIPAAPMQAEARGSSLAAIALWKRHARGPPAPGTLPV